MTVMLFSASKPISENIMQPISHTATERTPQVDFDFPDHRLRMSGESYPEDAAAFFGPLLQALREYLNQEHEAPLTFTLEMLYFNSSSAKALMNMFQMLEDTAARGREITIYWRYHRDDDTMEEFGEDFAEDFVHGRFELCPLNEPAP